MKLFKVKAPSAGRILNIWNKAYVFDKNAECLIPEVEAGALPPTYKIIWATEDKTKTIPVEEVKKIVKEKKDIKKVFKEKLDIKKDSKKNDTKITKTSTNVKVKIKK